MSTPAPVDVRGGQGRFDCLAVAAFWLAMGTMVLPVEAGVLFVFLRDRQVLAACIVELAFFGVVFAPYSISVRRHWKEPSRWRGEGYLGVTTLVLLLNAVWFAAAIARLLAS
jgi:hypothetical protein